MAVRDWDTLCNGGDDASSLWFFGHVHRLECNFGRGTDERYRKEEDDSSLIFSSSSLTFVSAHTFPLNPLSLCLAPDFLCVFLAPYPSFGPWAPVIPIDNRFFLLYLNQR